MRNDKAMMLMMFLLLGGVAEARMPLMLLPLAFNASNEKRQGHDAHDVPAVGRRS